MKKKNDDPTPTEIATLAVHLSYGSALEPRELARRALQFWDAAKRELDARVEREHFIAQRRAELNDLAKTIRMPKSFPVSFDKFLHLVVGQNTLKERRALFARYLKNALHVDRFYGLHKIDPEKFKFLVDVEEPTEVQVDDCMQKYGKSHYNRMQFLNAARSYLKWKETLLFERSRAALRAKKSKKVLASASPDSNPQQGNTTAPVAAQKPRRGRRKGSASNP